jgi:hypothetical protein
MISLQGNASLWISKGGVKLVLIVKIEKKALKMTMEQWIPSPESRPSRPSRKKQKDVQQERAKRNGKPTIINLKTLEISPNAPLILEFERVVGRPHKPPLEQDSIMFDELDLKDFAQLVKDSIESEKAMKERLRNAILVRTSGATGQDPSSSGTKRKSRSDNSETKKKRK